MAQIQPLTAMGLTLQQPNGSIFAPRVAPPTWKPSDFESAYDFAAKPVAPNAYAPIVEAAQNLRDYVDDAPRRNLSKALSAGALDAYENPTPTPGSPEAQTFADQMADVARQTRQPQGGPGGEVSSSPAPSSNNFTPPRVPGSAAPAAAQPPSTKIFAPTPTAAPAAEPPPLKAYVPTQAAPSSTTANGLPTTNFKYTPPSTERYPIYLPDSTPGSPFQRRLSAAFGPGRAVVNANGTLSWQPVAPLSPFQAANAQASLDLKQAQTDAAKARAKHYDDLHNGDGGPGGGLTENQRLIHEERAAKLAAANQPKPVKPVYDSWKRLNDDLHSMYGRGLAEFRDTGDEDTHEEDGGVAYYMGGADGAPKQRVFLSHAEHDALANRYSALESGQPTVLNQSAIDAAAASRKGAASGATEPVKTPATMLQEARAAIQAGADPQAVKDRLEANGVDSGGL